jgi:hypothetical protein
MNSHRRRVGTNLLVLGLAIRIASHPSADAATYTPPGVQGSYDFTQNLIDILHAHSDFLLSRSLVSSVGAYASFSSYLAGITPAAKLLSITSSRSTWYSSSTI